MIVREVFDNGLRLITEAMPHVRSISLGVWIARGSRHEDSGQSGISHFIEHMLFKGSASRSAQEIAQAIDECITTIEDAVLRALEATPPELASDIYKTGLYLTGGGALLRGLDKRISAKTKLPVHIAEDPLRAVVRGTSAALAETARYMPILIPRGSV